MFRTMDNDGDGMVSAAEFEIYCRQTEIPLGAERVSELFNFVQTLSTISRTSPLLLSLMFMRRL